jgi:hypothetical protein
MESVLQAVKDVPAGAWVGLLGVVFGSLLTTFGVWLTNRSNAKNIRAQLEHDERLHRQRATKERLEELYLLVCHWHSGMFKNFLNLTLVMKGHTDYNQYLDSVIALKPSEGIDLNRLEMILGVYGANVRGAYDGALSVREKINDIISAHKAAYVRGESGGRFLQPLTQVQLEFESACDSLKAAIAECARDA